jgi:hypothetical protein
LREYETNLKIKSKFAYWEESPKVTQVEWAEGHHCQARVEWAEELHHQARADLHHNNVVVIDNRHTATIFAYFYKA